jgi:cyanophycinase-like exopeptidase
MARLLALMGSGETSPTMTKVHRELLRRLGDTAPAVFLDTPAGFQMNADEVSARAVSYFRVSLQKKLAIATYKSASDATALEYESMLEQLRGAAYIFAGPGSPTYALKQWRSTAVADVLREKLSTGGCVTFASAAALTLGRFTLPVYEIYKVGEDVHWEEGLDLMREAGVQAAVITHYNNQEGGTHDTRYCYMGEARLRRLEDMLPDDVIILGIDEHTACIFDLDAGSISVEGLGRVTVRRRGTETHVDAGTTAPIEGLGEGAGTPTGETAASGVEAGEATPFWSGVAPRADAFEHAIGRGDVPVATNALLELEEYLSTWSTETFGTDEFDRARETVRRMITRLGEAAGKSRDPADVIAPFVEVLVSVRDRARREERWGDADFIRDALLSKGVEVRDGRDGASWSRLPKG